MREHRRFSGLEWWVWPLFLFLGLVGLAAGFGWFLIVVVVAAWLTVALYRNTKPAAPRHAREAVTRPASELGEALADASTDRLCQLWAQTGQELRTVYLPSTICSYAALRQAILDELTRRDPSGVSRWLHDAPDRNGPSRYLHDYER